MAWPETPCDSCPRIRKGLSLPCRAQQLRTPRICDLGNRDHPAYREDYEAVLCDENTEPAPQPAHEELAKPWSIDLLLLVYDCDRRGPKSGCSCNEMRLCADSLGEFPGRPHEVSMSRCLACVTGEITEASRS